MPIQETGITRSGWFVWPIFILLFFFVGVWGNQYTKLGGVIVDPIFDEEEPIVASNRFAENLGFEESISIAASFVNKTGDARGFDTEDVKNLIDFHKRFEAFLLLQRSRGGLDADLISIVNYDNYQFLEGLHESSPYIRPEMSESELSLAKRAMLNDSGIHGFLVGEDFTYVIFTLLLQPGQNERLMRDSLSYFLQGRPIGFMQDDIEVSSLPGMKLYPVGWPFARGWFSLISSNNNRRQVAIGFVLLLLFFWWFTKSWKHSLVLVGVVYGLSFFLLRGSIGIIDAYLFTMRERVFTELVYGLALVMSISMGTHVWHGYNKARRIGDSTEKAWAKMYSGIGRTVLKAAIVAIISYIAMAYSADLRPVREIGILFVLAVLYPWFLSLGIVPLIFRLKWFVKNEPARDSVSGLEHIFSKVSRKCALAGLQMRPVGVLLVTLVFLSVAALEIGADRFNTSGDPDRFIGGTYFEKSARFMNGPGKPGFNDFQTLIECEEWFYGENPAHNPKCIRDVVSFVGRVTETSEVRTAMSLPTGAIHNISEKMLRKPLPEAWEEIEDVFSGLLTSPLYLRTKDHFEWEGGYRVIFFSQLSSPEGLGKIAESVERVAGSFDGIRAHSFGSDALWVPMSRLAVENTRQNVLQDLFLLWFIPTIFLLLWWRVKGLNPFKVGVIVALPFAITSMVMVIVMAEFGIPLDIASATINQMVIGAAMDFLLFPLVAYIERVEKTLPHAEALHGAMEETGVAVTGDAFFNCCAFSLLIASSFLVIKLLGILLVIAVATTWASTMFLVLPLMRWARQ